jgi:uncharacterized protein YjbI with pentapeptide repeats
MKKMLILLALMTAVAGAQTTVIYDTLYRMDGVTPLTGPQARVTVLRVYAPGRAFTTSPQSFQADNHGIIRFTLPRGDSVVATISAPVTGFSDVGGVNKIIPNDDSTRLTYLQTAETFPPKPPRTDTSALKFWRWSQEGLVINDTARIKGLVDLARAYIDTSGSAYWTEDIRHHPAPNVLNLYDGESFDEVYQSTGTDSSGVVIINVYGSDGNEIIPRREYSGATHRFIIYNSAYMGVYSGPGSSAPYICLTSSGDLIGDYTNAYVMCHGGTIDFSLTAAGTNCGAYYGQPYAVTGGSQLTWQHAFKFSDFTMPQATEFYNSDLRESVFSAFRWDCSTRGVGYGFHGCYMNSTFWDACELANVHAENSFYDGAAIHGCSFRNWRVSATSFKQCTVDSCEFTGGEWGAAKVGGKPHADTTDFYQARMGWNIFTHVNFYAADTVNVRWLEARVNYCLFDACFMNRNNFTRANLFHTMFRDCDMTGAVWTGAVVSYCNFTGCIGMPDKETFKNQVANYTGCIWTDGTTL